MWTNVDIHTDNMEIKSHLGPLESATHVAYRRGFVDVDVRPQLGTRVEVVCTDTTGKVRATFTGKDITEACEKLIEGLW